MFGPPFSQTAESPSPAEAPERSDALSRLFEEHNRTLHSFLLTRLGNEQEAREVAQEAYVRLLQLDRPGTIGFLRAYLFKTVANLAVDRIRQQINRARLDQIAPRAETVDRLGPDHRLMATEELDMLERALFELPQSLRRAFVLHRFEECSTADIARDLGVRERSARNYISRVELLGGEAYFTVRHDPSRPFVVSVNGLSVRDVGTAFNVHEAAGRTAIAVIRGEVEVSPGAAPRSGFPARAGAGVRVSAGEELRWGRAPCPRGPDHGLSALARRPGGGEPLRVRQLHSLHRFPGGHRLQRPDRRHARPVHHSRGRLRRDPRSRVRRP